MTPLQVFEHFFPRTLFQTIVGETNRYHDQYKPNDAKWVQVTVDEMYAFLGMLLAMGITNLPDIYDYWSKEPITQVPWFLPVFSHSRFCEMLRFLHLSDNETSPTKESLEYRLYKMGPAVLDVLSKNCKANYYPGRDLAVDEQMVKTRCRVSFIQYMPKKPVKFSIKICALCDSATGYCQEFQIYKGKENETAEKGLTFRVVTDLLKDYLGKNHHLYTDNFYTSCALYLHLGNSNTLACGTIKKKNGRFPDDFKSEKWDKGTMKYL